MRLLQDGVVAALAAIGLTAVIFLLVSAIVHPRRRGTIPATAVIETCGEAKALEYTVRALLRSRYEEGGFRALSSWTAGSATTRDAWRSSCAAANTRSTSAKKRT